jgi:hypothetical protein
VLFTLGVVPLTAVIGGLTATPWESSPEPGCDPQEATSASRLCLHIWIVQLFVGKEQQPRNAQEEIILTTFYWVFLPFGPVPLKNPK